MKKLLIGIAMVLLMFIVPFGHAQEREGAVSITPYIGGYLFEGNQDLKHSPVFGLRGGYSFTKNLGLEGYFHYVKSEFKDVAGDPDMKLLGYGIDGLWNFMPGSRLVPFLAAGIGISHYDPKGMDNRDKLTLNWGGGVKYYLTDSVALRADVRHVNPFNDHYNDLLYTLGVTFAFGGAKKAPEVVAVRAAEPAAAPIVVNDSDGDGVPDDIDKCPGTPAGVQVDKDGCPLDSDNDGVPDYLDKCPGTPAGVAVDRDGCPLDTDGDGVPDYLDKCPGTQAGVKVDADGCPPPPPVVQKAVTQAATAMETAIVEKGRVTLNVEFDTNKTTLRKSSTEEIDKLAGVLKKYPDLKITIEGHTDNAGTAKYNEKLSQGRADAVKKSLVNNFGIEASRLTTKGYGLTKPIASNATKEGRQKNRRVEAAAEYIIKK